MIGLDAIDAAADSKDTGPTSDEVLGVDTDAVEAVSSRIYGVWEPHILATILEHGPSASHRAMWCHGFMAGVKAARTEAGA